MTGSAALHVAVVHPDRPPIPIGQHSVEILLPGTATAGAVGACRFTHEPITNPGVHGHERWAKFALVLGGEYDFQLDGQSVIATPGSVLVIPAGCAHGFTTRTGGQVLFVSWPAGNEELFVEVGALGTCPSTDELHDVWRRFGTAPA